MRVDKYFKLLESLKIFRKTIRTQNKFEGVNKWLVPG